VSWEDQSRDWRKINRSRSSPGADSMESAGLWADHAEIQQQPEAGTTVDVGAQPLDIGEVSAVLVECLPDWWRPLERSSN
jgi:hypothetical protein